MCVQPSRQGLGEQSLPQTGTAAHWGVDVALFLTACAMGRCARCFEQRRRGGRVGQGDAGRRAGRSCTVQSDAPARGGRWKVQAGKMHACPGHQNYCTSTHTHTHTHLWPGLAATPSLCDPWKPSAGRRAGWRRPRCLTAAAAAQAAARPQSAPNPRAQSAELLVWLSRHAAVCG
jgi:hypothetical protein